MKHMAVLLAALRRGGDDFARQFGTDMKPLVAIAGEPMVRRPVRALLAAECIGKVLILSQAPERIADVIPKDPRVSFGQSRETIAETMLELCHNSDTSWPVLVTTADHALLSPAMVDEFCRASEGCDVAVGVVPRASVLRRFPGSDRMWLKFRGGAYAGANLFILASPQVRSAIELWRAVEQDHKNTWQLISLLPPAVLLGTMLRLLSLDEVVRRLGWRLGLKAKAVRLSNPLAAVNVGTPAERDLVEDIIAGKV